MSDELKKIMTPTEITRYQVKAAQLLHAILTAPSNVPTENHEEALHSINNALLVETGDANLYLARGVCLLLLERYVEAHADCEQAVSLAPNDRNVRFTRALTRKALGDITGAFADLDWVLKDIKDRSTESAARVVRAELFMRQNRNSDAFRDLTGALEIDNLDPGNHYLRGIVANQLGIYRIALYDLDFKAFCACASKSEFYRLRAEASAGLGYATGAESDRYTSFLFDEHPPLQQAVDDAIRNSKNYDTAIHSLNKALSILHPHKVAEILVLRGFAKLGLNQHQAALEDFNAARAVDPLNQLELEVLLYGAKTVMMDAEDHSQLISECKGLVAREIKRAQGFMAAAVVKLNSGRPTSDDAAIALALLNAARNTSEHLPADRLHFFTALAKVWDGNYGDALLNFDSAIALEEDDPERVVNYSLRSVTHGLLKNYDKARKDIATAIAICLEMKGQHSIAKRLFPILWTLRADLGREAVSATYYEMIVPPHSFANEALQHIVSRHDMRFQ